jgi:hypothetical protein
MTIQEAAHTIRTAHGGTNAAARALKIRPQQFQRAMAGKDITSSLRNYIIWTAHEMKGTHE